MTFFFFFIKKEDAVSGHINCLLEWLMADRENILANSSLSLAIFKSIEICLANQSDYIVEISEDLRNSKKKPMMVVTTREAAKPDKIRV
jgi:hypothetical protein